VQSSFGIEATRGEVGGSDSGEESVKTYERRYHHLRRLEKCTTHTLPDGALRKRAIHVLRRPTSYWRFVRHHATRKRIQRIHSLVVTATAGLQEDRRRHGRKENNYGCECEEISGRMNTPKGGTICF
jgi:hypothetical protein